jgi:glucose/arabinose dehydrogenase
MLGAMPRPCGWSSLAALSLLSLACDKSRPVGAFDGGVIVEPDATVDDAGHVAVDAATFCDLPGHDVAGAQVPADVCIRKFATVKTPRVLAFAPNGDLFVGSPSSPTPGGAPSGLGGLFVLPDDDRDGTADAVQIYVKDASLATLHGVLFRGGNELLYTLDAAVFSVPYASGDRSMPSGKTATQIADLTEGGVQRFTHTLALGSDGALYVSRGQYDVSGCPSPNPKAGSVLRIGAGHPSGGDLVISGCRNPMYIRCEPWGSCYAAELTGDGWEDIGGTEKLIELKDGDDYGFPCCVDRNKPVPGISPPPDCSNTASSIQAYPLHDTPFGFDWDSASKWPAPYTGAFFVGLHGSFFSQWAGTRLAWAPTDSSTHRPKQDVATLVGGWGQHGPIVGRIADVVMSPDGRLFFSDDQGGAVYWVAPRSLHRP